MALDRKSVILIGIAILSAILAAWAVRSFLTAQQAETVETAQPKPQLVGGVDVLVAAEDLPSGAIVKAADLRWQQWPEDGLSQDYVTRETGDIEAFAGNVVRTPLSAGDPVTGTRLVRPGDRGFLAAVLTPGMRAFTIPISNTSGLAGLIFPGDRVDLIVTHTIADGDNAHQASETVMTDIRILAIDTRLQSVEGEARQGSTATVEVTPKQVEKIALAQRIGAFSLSLRSLAREETGEGGTAGTAPAPSESGPTFTWDSEVSRLLGAGGMAGGQHRVTVMRGDELSSQNFRKVGP